MARKKQPFVNPRYLTQEERDAKRKKYLRKKAREDVFVGIGVTLVILVILAALGLIVLGSFAINPGLGHIVAGVVALFVVWLLLRIAAS